MASSPDSQPEGPPSSPSPLLPTIPSITPITSPVLPNKSAPPPSTPSAPPPKATPPSPTATSPPPSPPNSPLPSPPKSPPPSPPSPPPQSPPATSPPPKSSPSPPPPESQDSSPPESSPSPPPPSPTGFLPPPPAPSRSRPSAPPVTHDSPPTSPPSPTTSEPSPPADSSSSPAPSTSTHSPPADSSPSRSDSTPRPASTSSHGKNVTVNSVAGSPSSPDRDQAVRMGIAVGVVAAVVIIGFMMAIVFVQRRRKRHDRYNSVYMLPSPFTSSQGSDSSFLKQNSAGGGVGPGGGGEFVHSTPDGGGLGGSKTWFTYEELTTATNGFASHNILGSGGFGCVYKGCLQDGRVVAVKKLKDNSGQGDREFKAEVEIISRVHHRYLVSLVGYCITDYQRLLVYEYVPNNTLHYHLHATNKPVMEWSLRVKVACGSARGLAYLHEDCHPRIIHRDIKSANILLENNFEAKVADFGLAKLAQELESNTHISTRVMGTFGYMAPEYASSGKLTEKSDVFSFGVVLLEMITGRKPVDETRPLGDESLVEWARPLMTEALDNQNFDELADPRLEGIYDRGEMFRMIEAAAACVRHSASKRPKMSQVVRALDTMSELSDLSNGMKPGQSGIYDSREQSAQIRMFQRMAFGSQEFSSENYNNSQGSSWTSGGRSGQV